MENKHNFMGIIITVIVAVILLTAIPILTNMSTDCPQYNIGHLDINPDFSSGDYNVDKDGYDYIDSATIIKDENLIPENIRKDVNIFGVVGTLESGGGEPPTDGDYLVRFIDYDGTILKEQWVNHGEDATPPDLPDYSEATNKRPALTFQEWNNNFTNVTHDIDIGVTYIPADGKTHAFVRLTVVSGKDVTLYLNKTDTSTLSIDWGDNITTTHTNNGNFNTSHTYSDYGDYEIKIWISSGSGEYGFGNGDSNSVFVGGAEQTQRNMLMYLFIGNNVSSIGNYAFQYCYSLTSINIPASVSSIGNYAFQYCYSLTSINIPASVSSIGNNTFRQCYSLTSINIPESVSSILDYAFNACTSLTSISIPASVSSISDYAFASCSSILKYVFNRTTPPTLTSTNTFNKINSICKIYVPDESVEAYKTATNWDTYADYIYPMSEMEGDN